MYKDMRLSMYETQVYKMLPYWKSVQRNTGSVDGHTASSFEVMVTMLRLTSFVWKRPTRKKNGYALGKSPACKSGLHCTAETKGCEKVEEVKKLVGLCFLSPEARSVEHSPAAYEFLKSLRPTKCVNNVGKRIIFSNVTGEGVEMECCFTHFSWGLRSNSLMDLTDFWTYFLRAAALPRGGDAAVLVCICCYVACRLCGSPI